MDISIKPKNNITIEFILSTTIPATGLNKSAAIAVTVVTNPIDKLF